MENIKLCTAYRQAGKTLDDLPFGPSDLSPYEPVYEQFPGWKEDVGGVRNWNELPSAARDYLDRIASLAGVPIRLASVGPERDQVVEKV
jgi:adenylosuccinate synthase